MSHAGQAVSKLSAPPAEAFPDWPAGWYVIALSREVTRRPIAVELWGRRLVCFRAEQGSPVVMDARCWHMGADLSQGMVQDGQIACPFHGWRYGASGNCEHIPSQTEIPCGARQQTYCSREFAGRVFVYPAAQCDYPLPFFSATNPGELIAAPSFEFLIGCAWWLVGTNGFDLQHFCGLHNRRLMATPSVETPDPAARRIVATFEVCGRDWRDRLTRRFAGRYVTMDVTVWSGTLAFVCAHFHESATWDGRVDGPTSYGMTEICPVHAAPGEKARVRVTIFRRRRFALGLLDRFDVRIKRYFISAFLKPDTLLLEGASYQPDHLISADREMIDYLRWLAVASRRHPTSEEPT